MRGGVLVPTAVKATALTSSYTVQPIRASGSRSSRPSSYVRGLQKQCVESSYGRVEGLEAGRNGRSECLAARSALPKIEYSSLRTAAFELSAAVAHSGSRCLQHLPMAGECRRSGISIVRTSSISGCGQCDSDGPDSSDDSLASFAMIKRHLLRIIGGTSLLLLKAIMTGSRLPGFAMLLQISIRGHGFCSGASDS